MGGWVDVYVYMPVRKVGGGGKSVTRLGGPITKPPVIILITRTLCNRGRSWVGGTALICPQGPHTHTHTWLLLPYI